MILGEVTTSPGFLFLMVFGCLLHLTLKFIQSYASNSDAFCHKHYNDTNFCPPLGFMEEGISAELHSGSLKYHTITHYVTFQSMYFSNSLAGFCPYGSMSSLWVNYQVCQAPTPAPRPPRKKNITLQGQNAGLLPLVLPHQFSKLPEMSLSAGDLLNHNFS